MDEELQQLNKIRSSSPVVYNTFNNANGGIQASVIENLSVTVEESVSALDILLKGIPRPIDPKLPPPEIGEEETDYIQELYRAYGDAEGVPNFTDEMLEQDDEYMEDLSIRRIDYFSAEAIRKSVDTLCPEELRDQFSILKNEVYNTVESTAKRRHINGYERMLAVMERAADAMVDEYILKCLPHWINNRIKKGVCHFLVSDGKLKWVKKRNG